MLRRILICVSTLALIIATGAFAQGQGGQSAQTKPGNQGGQSAQGNQNTQGGQSGQSAQGTQGTDRRGPRGAAGGAAGRDAGGAGDEQARDQRPLTVQRVLNRLHRDNQEEVKLGQLAQEKGQSDHVKEFGKMLTTDHQKADELVKQAAKDQKIELREMPQQGAPGQPQGQAQGQGQANRPGRMRNEMMQKLQGLSGAEFDKAFGMAMVDDHQRAIDLVDRALKQQDLKPVHDVLNKIRPDLEKHLEHAKMLAKETGGGQADNAAGSSNANQPAASNSNGGNEGGAKAGRGANAAGGAGGGAGAGGGVGAGNQTK